MANDDQSRNELLQTPRFTVVEQQFVRPDGGDASLTYVRHPGAVVILPILPDGQICLIRSLRLTVGKTILELPAGTREPDEDPQETARRELQEETGYQAGNIAKLAEFYTSPGVLDEKMLAYVATGLSPGPPAREPNEQIENLVVSWDQAIQMVRQGEIEDAKTLVTLLLYERQEG